MTNNTNTNNNNNMINQYRNLNQCLIIIMIINTEI